jgi:uncharacterized protein (TIGR03437 family)
MSCTTHRVHGRVAGLIALVLAGGAGAGRSAEPPQRYALVLSDAPLARQVFTAPAPRAALSTPAAETKRRQLLKAQNELQTVLGQHQIAVTGSVHILANALFVTASPDRVAELRELPGVAAVIPMPALRRKLNKALSLVNASTAWAAAGGAANSGAGIKIAILDTGIDETHPGFEDPLLAMPAGFPVSGNADDATHTTNKIIAVRSFVSLLAIGDGIPEWTRPDDLSARDRVGHGTATAMIAAGVSHQSPIGAISGVAPKAWLGNYKIFGSPGVNDSTSADVVLEALEAAFSDGMDVALVSAGDIGAVWSPTNQGADCGQTAGVSCDPLVGAVSAAGQAGMTIVLPAGNDGDSGWETINSPGDYAGAITVGATTNAHTVASTVSTLSGDILPARLGDGPQLQAPLVAPLFAVASVDATEHGCLGFPAGALTGTIALMSMGECSLATKVLNAQAGGAVGALIFNQTSTLALTNPSGLANTAIPAATVSAASGTFLKQYLSAHAGTAITLTPTTVETGPATGGAVADFSSQGPNIGNLGIKPDLVAPGASIYTAAQNYDPNGDLYSANRYRGADGTSFAAALAAGGAALVKQAHPGYGAGQIQSALANTASSGITSLDANGNPVTARSITVGGGQMNLAAALASTLTAAPVSVGFGAVASVPATRSVVISNTGTASASLQLTVAQRDADSVASVTVSPAALTLTAGQSGTVTVSLAGGVPAPGIYEGVVQVAGGSVPFRIPYLYLVGDGTPYSLIPVLGQNFVTESATQVDLVFRAVDQYGVPVANMPLRFAPPDSVYAATEATDSLGIGAAYMTVPTATGDQSFSADLAGNAGRIEFAGRTRTGPEIAAGGVVDAASFLTPHGFAAGSYITIFGSGLSETPAVYQTPYLPLSLAGVSVSFDAPSANIHVPGGLYYVSGGQISVQIPWELAGAAAATVKVTLSDSASRSIRAGDTLLGTYQSQLMTVPLAAWSPAFFEYPEAASGKTLAAALDENNALVSSANPVARGHVVQFFVNGLGAVLAGTQPASGQPSPATVLARTATVPTVTIGGVAAQVEFSGLAPDLVGLYQVNAVVPTGVGAGLLQASISIGQATSKTTLVPVR